MMPYPNPSLTAADIQANLLQRNWPTIQSTDPPSTVHVNLIGFGNYEGPVDESMEPFVWQALQDHNSAELPLAVLVDGRLRELTTLLKKDARAEIIGMSHPDGARIYRRSLTLLLVAAIANLFPEENVAIEHAMPFGAYYCTMVDRPPLTQEEIAQVEAEMWRLVHADLPITRRRAPVEEMVDLFADVGDESKVNLLAHLRKESLAIYKLDQVENYFHGYMAPSTGYLAWFALSPYDGGFLLRFPRRSHTTELMPIQPGSPLLSAFQEYREWMERMALSNLGALNNRVVEGKMSEIVLISEALHERRIVRIASTIADSWAKRSPRERIRVVLIAGPSSSGKTTFAKRLGVQLLANGIRPYALSLDNYFVERTLTPLDEDGNYDFESLQAINLPLLNQQLLALMNGEEVTLPNFNFFTGRSEEGETVQIEPNQVLIVEGIHGLNPQLTTALDPACTLRVYVSVVAHLNMDLHNRVSTSDVRLLRRICRDNSHRGYTASQTIDSWLRVRRGEEQNIFPFQGNADVVFNSALLYELCVLRPLVEPLLLQIDWDTPPYVEARRLLSLLRWVRPVEADVVPDNSIIREFIGGSILRRFSLL
jgi:uridine kinase